MVDKLCFYTHPFPRVKTYFDMVDTAVEYGLSAVEAFNMLDFGMPDKEKAKAVREYADSKGVIFPCFSVFADISIGDFKENVRRLKDYAEIAGILGSPYLHHTIVGECRTPERVLTNKAELFNLGIDAAREVYDYAESLGVKTIVEEQGYIFNGIEGVERFLDSVKRDMKLVADFGNIFQSGDSPEEFVKYFAGSFVHAHIKDFALRDQNEKGTGFKTLTGQYIHEVELGKGDVNLEKVFDVLKKSGYTGFYGLEFGAESDDSSVVSDAISMIDDFLA